MLASVSGPAVSIPASAVAHALERAWSVIRAHHPEVPDAVIMLGPGEDGRRGEKLGHWSAGRWALPGEGRRGEVLIAGEALARPAADTMEVLLHEAAHGLAFVRRIQDTSREGRYHNRRYKALAEEVGLAVAQHDKLGWTDTSLRPDSATRYADVIADLDAAHAQAGRAHRVSRMFFRTGGPAGAGEGDAGSSDEGEAGGREGGGSEGGEAGAGGERGGRRVYRLTLTCTCEPPRRIKIAPGHAELGAITCGVCCCDFNDATET